MVLSGAHWRTSKYFTKLDTQTSWSLRLAGFVSSNAYANSEFQAVSDSSMSAEDGFLSMVWATRDSTALGSPREAT